MPFYKKWWVWAIAVVVILIAAVVVILIAAIANGVSGTTNSPQTPPAATAPAPAAPAPEQPASSDSDSSFKDGTLTTPEMKIIITNHKVIPVGKKGNEYGEKPVIAFWYKVTNVAGKELDPSTAWIFAMKTYQDNNPNAENELEVGSLPDERFLNTQTEKIKQGGTVENAVAYELDDLKTPVDLVASSGLGSDEIGRMQFEIKK